MPTTAGTWANASAATASRMPGAVWVHAVSLGEMRSAVPLVRALLARGDRVVTTHFTPAGRREAERVFAAEIAAGRMAAVWIPFEIVLGLPRVLRARSAPSSGW